METQKLKNAIKSLVTPNLGYEIPFFNYDYVIDEYNYKPIADMLAYLPNINFGANSNIQRHILQYANDLLSFHKSPLLPEKGCLLFGGVGSGKTDFLKMYSFISHIFGGNAIKYVHSRDLMAKYELEGMSGIIEYVQKKGGFLVIDEIGLDNEISFHYGNKTNIISDLILTRYEMWKNTGGKTFFSTNLSIDELKKKYDERVFSRMFEMCNFVVFDSSDRRDTPKNGFFVQDLSSKIKNAEKMLDHEINFLNDCLTFSYHSPLVKNALLNKLRDIWRNYPMLRGFILAEKIADKINQVPIISEEYIQSLKDKNLIITQMNTSKLRHL
jgi:hypothetical protein